MGIDKISADILSRTTQILRSGSESDIKRLRQYLAKFKIEKPEGSKGDEGRFQDFPQLLQALRNSSSSNEAMELLNAQNPSKGYLVQLSKEIGLPVAKSDRLEHLKSKIIHELVEARLNSEAIRNPNSKQNPK
ncbi:hypothetical protein [Sulfitobacter pacificus]|uniref:hypothetical protein n=1 Tax=Sulfitobacter pacificus TaxID=1499314 RepID=UPI00310ADF02